MKPIPVVLVLLLLALPAGREAAASSLATGKRTARVDLRVFPTAVDIAQAPRAVLVNTGEVTIEANYIFKLERKTDDGWRWINRRQGWILPLLFLEPGETSRPQRIGIWRTNPDFERCPRSEPCCIRIVLRPGLYRVTKGARVGARQLISGATFRVLDKPTGTAE